ncbi:Dyp-type peroxidase [Komagataeibacter rhaeticus]|nr:Dyp-type peroxidase [Komagataeibacter rhaeticus]
MTGAKTADQTVRDLMGDLSSLQRAVGFRIPDGQLSCITGIGSDAWDRLFGGPARVNSTLCGDQRCPSCTLHAGDLLFHIRATRMDLCFELATNIVSRLEGAADVVDEVHGFKYFDERDLLGFVDGTENPTGQAARDATLIGAEDIPFSGGSYVISTEIPA